MRPSRSTILQSAELTRGLNVTQFRPQSRVVHRVQIAGPRLLLVTDLPRSGISRQRGAMSRSKRATRPRDLSSRVSVVACARLIAPTPTLHFRAMPSLPNHLGPTVLILLADNHDVPPARTRPNVVGSSVASGGVP